MELYENELKKYSTQWVTCSKVKENPGESNGGELFIPYYSREEKIYYFSLKVGDVVYFYDLYGIDSSHKPRIKAKLPKEQSSLYLIEAMKILSSYRESLNEYTLSDLDFRLERLGDGNEEIYYREMVPRLFYHNLVKQVATRKEMIVVGPGQKPDYLRLSEKRCIIRPVYGSSYSPMIFEIGEGVTRDRISIVFQRGGEKILANTIPPRGGDSQYTIVLEKDDELVLGVQYIILAFLKTIVEIKYHIDARNLVNTMKNKFTDISHEMRDDIDEIADNRLNVLDKEILYAVKLSQLYENNQDKQAERARKIMEHVKATYKKNGFEEKESVILTLSRMISDFKMIDKI